MLTLKVEALNYSLIIAFEDYLLSDKENWLNSLLLIIWVID